MEDNEDSSLAPATVLDADILHQIFDFKDNETAEYEVFVKRLRAMTAKELRNSLKPFLKQLPYLSDVHGKTVKKPKRKASVLLLQRLDVRKLHKRFGQSFESEQSYQQFIEDGSPDEVSRAIKLSLESDRFVRLPDSLQCKLKNRALLLRQQEDRACEPEFLSTSDESLQGSASATSVDLSRIQVILDKVDGPQRQQLIVVYTKALESGRAKSVARKEVKKAMRRLEASITHVPKSASPTQFKHNSDVLTPAEHANATSLIATAKRKFSQPDTVTTSTRPMKFAKRSHPPHLSLGGRADLRTPALVFNPSDPTSIEEQGGEAVAKISSSSNRKQKQFHPTSQTRNVMSSAESQLLMETLRSTSRENLSIKSRSSVEMASSWTSNDGFNSNRSNFSRQSTPLSSISHSSSEDDLLRECLKATSRRTSTELRNSLIVEQQATKAESRVHHAQSLKAPSDSDLASDKKSGGRPARMDGLSSVTVDVSKDNTAKAPDASSPISEHYCSANAVERRQMEDSFLLECLSTTARKPVPVSETKVPQGPDQSENPNRPVTSPLLRESNSSKASTAKRAPAKKTNKTARATRAATPGSTSSEDVQALLDAQLRDRSSASARSSPMQSKTPKRPFHHPMNCETM